MRARVATHNAGKGAKYTRGRRPVKLVYREPVGSRGAALKREAAITPADRGQARAGRDRAAATAHALMDSRRLG